MMAMIGCKKEEAETKNTYKIKFVANGGIGEMQSQIFYGGDSITLAKNMFTRSGYTFCGWYTLEKETYYDGQKVKLNSDITLYARWFSENGNGEINGYKYVDLGLPSGLLWATCNVGSNAPEDYGAYYAWGEIIDKDYYSWSTYKYCFDGRPDALIKYCRNIPCGHYGFTDNLTKLEESDDVAATCWGSGWRMPTYIEMQELLDNCICTWITWNGVKGMLFSGFNGNSIILPSAGFRNGDGYYGVGVLGTYWSSSLYAYNNASGSMFAMNFDLYSDHYDLGSDSRYYGKSVRPVCFAN